jgi:hypothetical protein
MTNAAGTEQITIYARDMLTAQGDLTAEQRASLVAKANRFREITGTTGKTTMNVPVRDVYEPHALIGYMGYNL